MLFKAESIQAMRAGHKLQTRRPAYPADTFLVRKDDRPRFVEYVRSVPTAGQHVRGVMRRDVRGTIRQPWPVGQERAVCPGRGKPQVGRIKITDLRLVPADRITHVDAMAEGVVAAAFGLFKFELAGDVFAGETPMEAYLAGLRALYPAGFPTRYLWAISFEPVMWIGGLP